MLVFSKRRDVFWFLLIATMISASARAEVNCGGMNEAGITYIYDQNFDTPEKRGEPKGVAGGFDGALLVSTHIFENCTADVVVCPLPIDQTLTIVKAHKTTNPNMAAYYYSNGGVCLSSAWGQNESLFDMSIVDDFGGMDPNQWIPPGLAHPVTTKVVEENDLKLDNRMSASAIGEKSEHGSSVGSNPPPVTKPAISGCSAADIAEYKKWAKQHLDEVNSGLHNMQNFINRWDNYVDDALKHKLFGNYYETVNGDREVTVGMAREIGKNLSYLKNSNLDLERCSQEPVPEPRSALFRQLETNQFENGGYHGCLNDKGAERPQDCGYLPSATIHGTNNGGGGSGGGGFGGRN